MDKVTVNIHEPQRITAQFGGVRVIARGGGTTDYNELTNKPSINEHVLTGGENALTSLGIGRASIEDINRLFREG